MSILFSILCTVYAVRYSVFVTLLFLLLMTLFWFYINKPLQTQMRIVTINLFFRKSVFVSVGQDIAHIASGLILIHYSLQGKPNFFGPVDQTSYPSIIEKSDWYRLFIFCRFYHFNYSILSNHVQIVLDCMLGLRCQVFCIRLFFLLLMTLCWFYINKPLQTQMRIVTIELFFRKSLFVSVGQDIAHIASGLILIHYSLQGKPNFFSGR